MNQLTLREFARQINRFERDYPGKLDSLFTDSATGRNTAKLVRDTIAQVNKINPRLKPQDIKNLVNDFTINNKGLGASDQGLAFVQGLKQLATASENRLKLEANRAISDLPLKGIDETVNIIFRPNANANIQILKDTVSDEVFTSIQQARNIPLPDVSSIEMPNMNPLSQDRLNLDEQLFGRPSRLG
jgi:hypothetical protein